MKKKFLHVCLSKSWGGLEMAVTRWNQVLTEMGNDNLNIVSPHSPLHKDLKEKGFHVLAWENQSYFSPQFTYKLRNLVKEQKVDAVLIQNLRELWLVSPALWGLSQVKLLGFTQMLVGVKKTDALHRLIYDRLDALFTLTQWQQQALSAYLPVPEHKFHTIPNFVDCTHFKPERRSPSLRKQWGVKESDFLIGVIGRIDEQKGQKELLLAFRDCIPKHPNLRLCIIGEPTHGEAAQENYFSELQKIVEHSELKERVFFLPFQKDTADATAQMDLFVMPSYRETFGFVLIEAMASGVPVVSTLAGGVPEILQEGKLGYLAKPKDVASLADQLLKALLNPAERAQKTKLALDHVRHFYDRKAVAKRLMDFLYSH